ncbi:hypothetical protein [uncultured Desulfovibrio sp.]|uniref:hypothetical protein n=1 Tax=uncultured Desulfovibrio sp. TaxID=167968 RepID=UPI00262BAD32|nr:hypothetical protein [uncultured Desulfovibrio sp.]
MSKFRRNEHGLMVRANSYGRTSYGELAREMDLKHGETLYAVDVEKGAKVSRPIKPGQKDVSHKPGTTFVAGPTITKASGLLGWLRNGGSRPAETPVGGHVAGGPVPTGSCAGGLPPVLKKEVAELHAAGFGAVPPPEKSKWGWVIKLKGLVLAGGIRTDAMILLPAAYPAACPIGFYLREGACTGTLDTGHVFKGAYHGAPDLSADGWMWFCGVAGDWIPGRHTLLSYVTCVFAMFTNEGLEG